MLLSGAMRVWVVGELVVAADGVMGAVLGVAGHAVVAGELGERLVIIAAAVALFFVPAELALRFPAVRGRWWFWAGGSVPAVLWVPAMPFAFLAVGPPLDEPAGLASLAGGIVGAVLVLIGGAAAALEARRGEAPA